MTTYRVLKIASNIQYVITQNIREVFAFDKEMLDAMITITKVSLSSDLRIANCYFVSGYHSNISQELVLSKLNNVKHIFRKIINKSLILKYSPEIRFFYDVTIDNVDKIHTILSTITKD